MFNSLLITCHHNVALSFQHDCVTDWRWYEEGVMNFPRLKKRGICLISGHKLPNITWIHNSTNNSTLLIWPCTSISKATVWVTMVRFQVTVVGMFLSSPPHFVNGPLYPNSNLWRAYRSLFLNIGPLCRRNLPQQVWECLGAMYTSGFKPRTRREATESKLIEKPCPAPQQLNAEPFMAR